MKIDLRKIGEIDPYSNQLPENDNAGDADAASLSTFEFRQPATDPPKTCQSFDWYSEGEGRVVEVAGVRFIVRFVGRKGRRARIVIEAPGGAVFSAPEKTA